MIQTVNLSEIKKPQAPPPSKGFVKSLEKHGKIFPVILKKNEDGYEVVEGRRSVLAAKELEWETIEAEVIESDTKREAIIRLLGNMQRSANPADEAGAIADLLKSGYDEAGIASELGISKTKITQRIHLLDLHPTLFTKLKEGKITVRAAQIAVSLPQKTQEELAKKDEITIADVREIRKERQLEILDVNSIEIPEPMCEEEILAGRLNQIASRLEGWRRDALLNASKALLTEESEAA